jgi:outer membrane receptor for ferrienterochelin and colicins
MKITLLWLVALLALSTNGISQHTLKIVIKNSETREPLPGATLQLKGTTNGASANEIGVATLENIPDGKNTFLIRFVGFHDQKLSITFPRNAHDQVEVLLEPDEEELEEVIVTSTRISRNIDNVPTRIESISFEEIDEKINMRPTNVSMLLHESTGIQVQQTSYASATQTIRIQGLDGKYTQLLKDGFPNYSGFSSGLSILDIPPLDLQQVEVIKGSASTLYGGGAIAGVVNFITKQPRDKREINLILNQTSALGTDVGSFFSGKNDKVGYTLLGTAHYQKEYDVDGDDFSELPRQKEFTIFPKLFVYPSANTKIIIGNNFTSSKRLGGDVKVVRGKGDVNHQYFEENDSYRNNTYFTFEHRLSETKSFTVKQSFNYFDRQLRKPGYQFAGAQTIAFTDVTYVNSINKHTFVLGANFLFDQFKEGPGTEALERDQTQKTVSAYVQDNWDISDRFLVEGGLRLDHHFTYNTFLLPRISLLYKIADNFSTRLGGGLGYKTPTIFVEETEARFFENVTTLTKDLSAEQSYGLSLDFNLSHDFTERFSVTFNQLFFYTDIQDPLVLQDNGNGTFSLNNERNPIRSMGFESNLRFLFDPLKLFMGYTFVEAKALYKEGNQFISLTPMNKLNLMLLLEEHGNYKIGLEGYFTDRQHLDDGRKSPTFWEFGFFAEKTFGAMSVFINFENFTDVRQNRFENVVTPPHTNPTFAQVYTHTEGFIVNGGLKFKF